MKTRNKPTTYLDGRTDDTTTLYFDKKANGIMQFLGHGRTEDEARRLCKNPQYMVVNPEQLRIITDSENVANPGQFDLSAAQTTMLREAALFRVETSDQFLILNRAEHEAYNEFVAAQETLVAEQH